MAAEKPTQFLPKITEDPLAASVQRSLTQVTAAIREQPTRNLITTGSPQRPGEGVVFKPGQTVDIPHGLGYGASSVNVAKAITNTPRAASAPYAAPNLQVVPVPPGLAGKIMRVRLIPPQRWNAALPVPAYEDVLDPQRLHLEIT